MVQFVLPVAETLTMRRLYRRYSVPVAESNCRAIGGILFCYVIGGILYRFGARIGATADTVVVFPKVVFNATAGGSYC